MFRLSPDFPELARGSKCLKASATEERSDEGARNPATDPRHQVYATAETTTPNATTACQ